jgi:hypothetical protein
MIKVNIVTILITGEAQCLKEMKNSDHIPKTLKEMWMQKAPDQDALSQHLMLT